MILRGEKREEYRETKPFYMSRFSKILEIERDVLVEHLKEKASPKMVVKFRNGYKNTSPSFVAECTVRVDTGHPEWGAVPGVECFVLDINNIR